MKCSKCGAEKISLEELERLIRVDNSGELAGCYMRFSYFNENYCAKCELKKAFEDQIFEDSFLLENMKNCKFNKKGNLKINKRNGKLK